MAIITLTSDLGYNSHYPAILKGAIYSLCSEVVLIDVTHNLPPYDLLQAAYVVKRVYQAYPKGTIHLVAVDPAQNEYPMVAMEHHGHLFVAPDNGVLSLITEGTTRQGNVINTDTFLMKSFPKSFRAARIAAPAVAFLASGGSISELGADLTLKDLRWGDPTYNGSCLKGKIIHIDNFGNAVTNIRRKDFLDLKRERRFEIVIRNIRLQRIVSTYADVGKADPLAIFGQGDHLEIAMREAPVSDLLGLKINDMISIDFEE